MSKLDRYDRKILEILQEDASVSISELAHQVGLTTSPCWRRVQRLEERGVIRKQVVLLDPTQLDLNVTVFIFLRTSQHRIEWFTSFHELVSSMPEVVEFYRVTGSTDYFLKVVVSNISGYDQFYKKLIRGADFTDVSSMFAMEQIKFTTALPIA